MIAALVRKELRHLRPLILALVALTLWAAIRELILEPADQNSLLSMSWLTSANQGRWEGLVELVVGVVIAYNLLPGEHEQRTIDFLYSLPVRRSVLFATKFAVGYGLLAGLDLFGTAQRYFEHALNRTSFERALFRPRLLFLELAADLFVPFVVVAYGMLLSFFRRLGWVLFLVAWLVLELGERLHAPLRALNIKSLLEVEHDGTWPLVNWRAWQLHAAMAAVALALAQRLWLNQHERFAAFLERLRKRTRLRRAGVVMGLTTAALLGGGFMSATLDRGPAEEDAAAEHTLTFETERFHFTYRAAQTDKAMVVIREADRAYERVSRWFPALPFGRIVADLTDRSHDHLGIAGWRKMRLDLRPKSPALLRHVLYHETTHVLAAREEPMPPARASELRFFAEGLAEYVAYELDGLTEQREHARLVAALAHRRFQLRIEDLMAPERFLARHDEYLLYALGEVWVDALVATCGPDLPARLVGAFADPDAPQALTGLELWRTTLQQQGCELDRVIGRYEQGLRRLEVPAAALPVASARLVGPAGDALAFDVQVAAPTPGPWPLSLRVRDDATTPSDDVRMETAPVRVGETRRLLVPRPARGGKRLEFQVGASRDPETRPFFTRWQSTTM
jgi:hypothetical protein